MTDKNLHRPVSSIGDGNRPGDADPTGYRDEGRRKPPQMSAKMLERAALNYLERYAASSQQLRQVLTRRIQKFANLHGQDPEGAYALRDKLIEKLTAAGLLNDRAYAAGKARSRHDRGHSGRAIAAFLKSKGLVDADIEHALLELSADSGDPDLNAALTYCRKRRAGPYRPQNERRKFQKKDMAALARQGFGYDIVHKVIDGELDDLERELATGRSNEKAAP